MPYLSQVSFRAPLFSCTSTRAFTLNCRLAAPLPLSGGRDGIVFLFLGSPALRQTQREGGGEGRREGGREEGGRSAGGWLTDSTASSPVSFLKKTKKKPSFVTSAGLLLRTVSMFSQLPADFFSLCLGRRGDVSNQWPASSGLSLCQMSRDEKESVGGPCSGLSSVKEGHGIVHVRCQWKLERVSEHLKRPPAPLRGCVCVFLRSSSSRMWL